jgi:uncharacterized protein
MRLDMKALAGYAKNTGLKGNIDMVQVEDFSNEKLNNRIKPSIQTYSGTFFDFVETEKSVFTIEDIARALSKICRFTGHVHTFYSVAQHSVMVSYLVPKEHAFKGLMHDSAEAFIGDVSSPLKSLLQDYKAIERRVEKEVFGRFGLEAKMPACVKRADLIALKTEQRDFMNGANVPWKITEDIEPCESKWVALGHEDAFKLFMSRFNELQT